MGLGYSPQQQSRSVASSSSGWSSSRKDADEAPAGFFFAEGTIKRMQDERQQDHSLMLPVVLAIVIIPLFLVVLSCGGFWLWRFSSTVATPPATPSAPLPAKFTPAISPAPSQPK